MQICMCDDLHSLWHPNYILKKTFHLTKGIFLSWKRASTVSNRTSLFTLFRSFPHALFILRGILAISLYYSASFWSSQPCNDFSTKEVFLFETLTELVSGVLLRSLVNKVYQFLSPHTVEKVLQKKQSHFLNYIITNQDIKMCDTFCWGERNAMRNRDFFATYSCI